MEKTSSKSLRLSPMAYGQAAFDSGANPDFQVTSASRNEREMRALMDRLASKSDRLERRIAALDRADAEVRLARKAAHAAADDASASGDDTPVIEAVKPSSKPAKASGDMPSDTI